MNTTLADKAKALIETANNSNLDDGIKIVIKAAALESTFRFADAESDIRAIASYQASAEKHLANGNKATYELASMVDLSQRAADSMKEAELKFEAALSMWDATHSLRS